jgi:RNA polymerase primary sigma factor
MNTAKQAKPRAPLNGLEIYFREINRTPLLTADQEKELARRIRAGDRHARDHMVSANLRLVVRVACRYARRGCNLEDLIAEGNVGLVKAADRYDPTRNTRFSTYAFYWIRLAIQQVLNAARPIRVSNHMAVLLSKWSRTDMHLHTELGRPPTPLEIADRLQVAVNRIPAVLHAMHIWRMEPRSVEGDPDLMFADFLLDQRSLSPEASAAEMESRQRLGELLGLLSDRESLVLRLRYGLDGEKGHTLQAIAERMAITRERVRQLETRALAKLRREAECGGKARSPDDTVVERFGAA